MTALQILKVFAGARVLPLFPQGLSAPEPWLCPERGSVSSMFLFTGPFTSGEGWSQAD